MTLFNKFYHWILTNNKNNKIDSKLKENSKIVYEYILKNKCNLILSLLKTDIQWYDIIFKEYPNEEITLKAPKYLYVIFNSIYELKINKNERSFCYELIQNFDKKTSF